MNKNNFCYLLLLLGQVTLQNKTERLKQPTDVAVSSDLLSCQILTNLRICYT